MNYQEDSFYINKVLGGNLPSYAILVEKHKNLAYTLALRIAKNHEDAEEIAQDAFLKAYNSLSSFKQESKFSTWLYKIVFNTAISRARKKQILNVSIESDPVGNTIHEDRISSLDSLHKKERKKIIAEAIARLKEEESVVMTLYYLNENNLKEIEDITGFSNSNIKILLHRGRKKLLVELKKILKEEIVDML
jgi:RNA polymerase sigma-70 factor (ECF subfamily)